MPFKTVPLITKFKMERDGQFLANWDNPSTKCGPSTAQPIYQYKCVIVTDAQLDENGFILDNLHIHQYFVATYGGRSLDARSCERMAAHAVAAIYKHCSAIQLGIQKIEVAISGMTGAWLTASWERE